MNGAVDKWLYLLNHAKGMGDTHVQTALDMLADNEPIEKIVKYSRLPMDKVLELRDSQATFTAEV